MPAHAQPTAADGEPQPPKPPTWTFGSGQKLTLFPDGDPYAVYLADPHRPTNAILANFITDVGIGATRSPRFGLGAGGRFGMLRIDPPNPDGRSWQLSIDAGLDALFDSQNKQDVVGWDGNYGLTVTTAARGLAFKVGLLHVSGHMGDEYAERTGQQRINYTREELALGVSRRFARRWRAYGELGGAYVQRYEGQEPWRVQGGAEYEATRTVWGGRFAWYGAADLSMMEERGWRLDKALQGGLVTRSDGRTVRLGLQLHDGRPTVAEFFKVSEISLTLGFWIDF